MRTSALLTALAVLLLPACDTPNPMDSSTDAAPGLGNDLPRFMSASGADLPFSQPVPFAAQLDNRTCLIGIFTGPQNLPLVHRWNVRVGGSQVQNVTLRVDAHSVNANDRGTLRATLRDLAGNQIATADVAYTGSPTNTGDLTATLSPGVYRLSLEAIPTTEPPPAQSGQHYQLGASAGVALGWAGPLNYNESGGPEGHFWAVNAGAGEPVQVVFSVDGAGPGVPNQATSITYEVRNADNTAGPVAPTTAAISPTQPVTVAFTSAQARAYLLRVAASGGHYRSEKTSGGDRGFYGVQCNPPPPPPPRIVVTRVQIDIKPGSDPNSINLGSKGLVAVAVLTRPLEQATPEFPAFDATRLDPSLLRMMDLADFVPGIYPQGAIPVRGAVEDVDGDGDLDLVVHFATQDLDNEGFQGGRFDPSTTAARLFGPVPPPPGQPVTQVVSGDDAVRIVGR
ncbi:MAG: hypothetical protein HY703_13440 [Gemmatimonadetes bacterium]|nr:hypothetical protein [Gemmatimonadota bacterium]